MNSEDYAYATETMCKIGRSVRYSKRVRESRTFPSTQRNSSHARDSAQINANETPIQRILGRCDAAADVLRFGKFIFLVAKSRAYMYAFHHCQITSASRYLYATGLTIPANCVTAETRTTLRRMLDHRWTALCTTLVYICYNVGDFDLDFARPLHIT